MATVRRKLSVISALVLAASVPLLLIQRVTVVRLAREKHLLEQEIAEQTDRGRLSTQRAQARGKPDSPEEDRELLQLRDQAGRLRHEDKELNNLRKENRQFRAMLAATQNSQGEHSSAERTSENWPKSSWSFAGYATPEASLESGLWAARSGDVSTFLNSITGEIAATVQKDLEGKSEEEVRAKMTQEVAGMKSCRILKREFVSTDEAVFTVSMGEGEQNATTAKLTMKKVANEWKFSGKSD